MWKIIVGFLLFAALAIWLLLKGGDIDMSGEQHGVSSTHSEPAKPAEPAPAAATDKPADAGPAAPAAPAAGDKPADAAPADKAAGK